MSNVKIHHPRDFKQMPWRNGQGTTIELLAEYPAGSPQFNWRLSMAKVGSDGPFSDFAGYDRTLILLEGQGLELSHENGRQARLEQPMDKVRFQGEWQTQAKLLDGPILDFNIMTRREACSATVDCFSQAQTSPLIVSGDQLLIYAVDQDLELAAGPHDQSRLPAGALLQVKGMTAGEWTLTGGRAICIQINCRAPSPQSEDQKSAWQSGF